MSNSNYGISLQGLKPVQTPFKLTWFINVALNNLAENWSWARDVNGRDRDVDNFSRDETETRRWYVLRPSRDRAVETETTTMATTPLILSLSLLCCHWQQEVARGIMFNIPVVHLTNERASRWHAQYI